MHIHRSLVELNESPVYMLFNPRADLGGGGGGAATTTTNGGAAGRAAAAGGASASGARDGGPGVATTDLPISLFETVVHAAADGAAAVQTFEPAVGAVHVDSP
jgi:hypothetical protein